MGKKWFKLFVVALFCLQITFLVQGQARAQQITSSKVLLTKQYQPKTPLPDLMIEKNVKCWVFKNQSGLILRYSGNYKNVGTADAKNYEWIVEIRRGKAPRRPSLRRSKVLQTMGPNFVPSMPKGKRYSLNFTHILTFPTKPGIYNATYILDSGKTVAELKENNNRKIVEFKIVELNRAVLKEPLQIKKPMEIALADLQFENDVKVRVRYQQTSYFLNFDGHFKNSGAVDANGVRLVVHIRKIKPTLGLSKFPKRIIKTIGPVYWPKIAKKTTALLGFGSAIPHSAGKGKFSATLILDPDDTITELSENNNQKVVTFVIK